MANDELPEPDPEDRPPLDAGAQRGMEVDSSRYLEPGRLAVAIAADGLPIIAGEPPAGAEPGLSDDNLICLSGAGRERCRHYVALLRPADGVSKGLGQLRQIRRFCRALATTTELFEVDGEIHACTARSPQDDQSARLIEEFEHRQKAIAKETSASSGEMDF